MKMCSISVAPMPSMIRIPVALCHASTVGSGKASPAEMHFFSDEMSCADSAPSMARYAVGAVKQTVARHVAIAGSNSSGGAFQTVRVDLGDFVMEHEFSPDEERLIIETYYGQMDERAFGRLMLYKALSGERSPDFDTILKVVEALGLELHAEARSG